jgi:hypothetical protein
MTSPVALGESFVGDKFPMQPIFLLQGSHSVGDGGDAFDDLFYLACERAVKMVFSYDNAVTPLSPAEAETHSFIKANRLTLAKEILKCDLWFSNSAKAFPHPEVEESCALTNVDPELVADVKTSLDTVYLSRPTCLKQGIDEDGAARILIHEAVHHFVMHSHSHRQDGRITDEIFCNQVAKQVYLNWRRLLEQEPRRWVSDPKVAGAPSKRAQHTAVWTGETGNEDSANRMILWGGCAPSYNSFIACGQYFNTGGIYNQKANNWQETSVESAPEGRTFHSAVWTGNQAEADHRNKMIVWGGCRGAEACNVSLQSGGIFDPAAPQKQAWTPTAESAFTPQPRVFHSAVWADDRMLIWGGTAGYKTSVATTITLGDGAAYFPPNQTNILGHWESISKKGKAPTAREGHTSVWTGKYMVVWGGCDPKGIHYHFCRDLKGDGARYDVGNDVWLPMATENAPTPRRLHTAVWTGKYMIVWGGEGETQFENTGALYDPELDLWEPINHIAPTPRSRHVAVWTGRKMIIWGGSFRESDSLFFPEDVGEYYPDPYRDGNDYWEIPNLSSYPVPTHELTGVWTGKSMIVWGGNRGQDAYFERGGTYYSIVD